MKFVYREIIRGTVIPQIIFARHEIKIVYKNIYLDTTPIIYLLDHVMPWFTIVRSFIHDGIDSNSFFYSSTITNTEYLPFPLRNGDMKKVSDYDKFKRLLNIQMIEPTENISVAAANIRAKYHGIKGMDAIHIATCIAAGCDVLLTNDKQLLQVSEANVVLVDNL